MNARWQQVIVYAAIASPVFVLGGCGDSGESDAGLHKQSTGEQMARSPNAGSDSFQPLSIPSDDGRERPAALSEEKRAELVRRKLLPFQLWVDRWRGTTRNKVGQFAAVEEVNWKWDYSDKAQPALEMTTTTGAYFQQGRLTWLPEEDQYQFTALDKNGIERTYRGEFIEPPRDEPGTGNRTDRKFKLQLTQVAPEEGDKMVQLVFNQQRNHRYLLELFNRRGENLFRYDTIGTQREDTSFAVSEDYGRKACIISGGLGTKTVEYGSKTYWVCCSGCEAAFRDDPEKWIAKASEEGRIEKE